MEKPRILFVSQEITPYLPENELSLKARYLPQAIQERGKEIRTFMPRYGVINERRHQLHEVIRLSGMNMIIDDTDHPLLIKVASIQQARMQVYFIDNEEYFKRKAVFQSPEGVAFEDNDERSIFFCRGVLETVKKLGWSPDVIHCHGWMTGLIPMYIKKTYKDDPIFENTKVVYSVYNNKPEGKLAGRYAEKAIHENIEDVDVEGIKDPTYDNIHYLAAQYSDGIVLGNDDINPELVKKIEDLKRHYLGYQGDDFEEYAMFFEQILEKDPIMVE